VEDDGSAVAPAVPGISANVRYSGLKNEEDRMRYALRTEGVVVSTVLRRVLLLAGAGLAISVPAASIGFRLVKSFLFETRPNDPVTLAMAGVVLPNAAILAGYVPARRASRIDPLAALRHE
jgi:ABC-type lipoprotein release transport system permease subunit